MDFPEIIFAAIIAVASITKVIVRAKDKTKQTSDIENNTQTISSDSLGTNTEIAPLNVATPVQQPTYKEVKKRTATTPKKDKNRAKTEPDDSDENTFDLRKAVIYSEILTPKFKDEEF